MSHCLTCANREVGDVLITEGLFVGDAVCQDAQSRATHHGDLGPVPRPAQQPVGRLLDILKRAAAGSQGSTQSADIEIKH